MSNTFYNVTGKPTSFAAGRSFDLRTEFASIAAAFDLLPNALGAGQKGFSGGTFQNAVLTSPTITNGSGTVTLLTATALQMAANSSNLGAAASKWAMAHISSGNVFELNYSSTRRFGIDANGNVALGDWANALATSATDGFLYLPRCAGNPSGTPTSIASGSPCVVDTSTGTGRLYIRIGSTWRYAALT